MPVYRDYVDTRDGTTYQMVKMPDGQWWSARTLAWAGAGVAHNDTATYGRLYTLTEALAACPAGCHIPTLNEYQDFGIPQTAKLKENSPLWVVEPGTDDYGFAVRPAGYEYNGTIGSVGGSAYLITSTIDGANYSLISVVTGNWTIGQGYDPVRFSVRFVLDSFPALFGTEFDGLERGMTVTIKRPIQVKESIGGTVRLIPYGDARFDEWQVETELWLNAERAAEFEAVVPPYGVPTDTSIRLPPRSGAGSFPGLLPAVAGVNSDQYLLPQVTAFESQGRKGVVVDLYGYMLNFTLRSWIDGEAANPSITPTTTAPTWLQEKFAAHQVQDWSNQQATISLDYGPSISYARSKHGRRMDYNLNLDHLSQDRADELVAFFRGVRHNATTITIDRGTAGIGTISVYLVGLTLHRTGLFWDGTLETIAA